MIKRGQKISDTCAKMFGVGYYHMLDVRWAIDNDSDLQRLAAVEYTNYSFPGRIIRQNSATTTSALQMKERIF